MSHVPDEQQTLFSTRPPTRKQKRLALGASLALLALFLVAFPFAHYQLYRAEALRPILTTTVFLADTITAALLLAKFAVLRRPALLALATGYLFAGLIVLPYATSLGVLGPPGWLGGGPRSSGWLFTAMHFGFPVAVIAYALLKDREPPKQMAPGSARVAILACIAGVLCLVAALTWLLTIHHDALPPVILNEIEVTPILRSPIGPAMQVVCAAAIALLWVRRRSLLDMWLLVVVWAWLLDSTLLFIVDKPFTVDWYAARILAMVCATLVLAVLLSEATTMHARLALSAMALRREREARLMTMDAVGASIAHEIRPPLAAIIENGRAALRCLAKAKPDVDTATQALKSMVDDGHRAGQVIARVRAIFRRDEPDKGYLDINDVIEDVLVLVRGELRRHGIVVDAVLDPRQTPINANKAQLQQVLLNLIGHAIEVMDDDTVWPRTLRVHTERNGQEVLVTVEDTGPGIDPKDSESIFDPLFTTKSGGTGLGLPICRSIIDAHGGRMWAAPGTRSGVACGTALHFTLPVAEGSQPYCGEHVDRRRMAAAQPQPASGLQRAGLGKPFSHGAVLPASRRSPESRSPATGPGGQARSVATVDPGRRTTVPGIADGRPMLLSTLPPTRGQERLALLAGLLLLGVFLVTLPFAHIQLGRMAAYIPVVSTVIFINGTITSALLFAQFSVLRTFALLVLAAGYLLTSLLVIVWMLAFPGVFGEAGLLGGDSQSPPWLYLFWTLGIIVSVIAYALLKEGPARRVPYGAERTAFLVTVVGILCTVAGLAWLATAPGMLPAILRPDARFGAEFNVLWRSIIPGSALLSVFATALLWARLRSLLDLWLLVVMWAWLMKSISAMLIYSRYDVAWYANVAFALVSATFVLLVLLSETTKMYARLALSVIAERREQGGRLMTMDAVAASIAHEINQPLAAIVNNGSAALRWLARATPDVGKASEALRAMVDDGRRASHVVDGIRATLRREQPQKEDLDINAVIEEVLVLVRGELSSSGIVVRTALDPRLPRLRANKVQLQQVLLNLIANAIEAMKRTTPHTRMLRACTARRGREALVTIEDNGAGVAPHDTERIFDPFFTTKARGTGLGLAISRSIVEAHCGRMWAMPALASGTALHFTLPLSEPGSGDA